VQFGQTKHGSNHQQLESLLRAKAHAMRHTVYGVLGTKYLTPDSNSAVLLPWQFAALPIAAEALPATSPAALLLAAANAAAFGGAGTAMY
jgi:hypothetical protein